ncbi:MAG: N-6 DNA methylase, partial [bacterium]|nr:N-6 DNA methylase [bacterium]
AILALTVCDPACGSGHFLVAAARRIAKRLAAVRSGDDEPSPEAVQEALRDVVGHCLYGVDINPMAVELCKVSLWMEAVEPGKPLSFLDHHIRVGNSLLGATPALLQKGIPDAAFKPIEGDDKAYCRELKKYNKTARETRQLRLFDQRGEVWDRLGDRATGMLDLDGISDATAGGGAAKGGTVGGDSRVGGVWA